MAVNPQIGRSGFSAIGVTPYFRTHQPAPTRGRTPEPQFVNFYALTGDTDLTVVMGDGEARLTGGDGGWQTADRWGLPPITYWQAPTPFRQAIPVLFGGASDGGSQEGRIGQLYSMMRSPGSRVAPPVVMIAGTAIQRADLQWVVESIEQGQIERRPGDGDRVIAAMTVNLLQYVAGDVLIERSPSRKAAGKGKHGTKGSRGRKTYKVKPGDTLPHIAARRDIYGDATQWKRIAHANGIRDPRSLVVGRTLKIPR